MRIERRHFVKSAMLAGASIGVPFIHAQSKGKKYRTAAANWVRLVGNEYSQEAMASGTVQPVALCDVDQDKLEIAAEEVEDLFWSSGENLHRFP